MKNKWVMAVLLMAAGFMQIARADEDLGGPTQDLTPISLSFRRVTGSGRVNGQVLRVSLVVRNVGTLPVRGNRGGVQVAGIPNPNAPLYGPSGELALSKPLE